MQNNMKYLTSLSYVLDKICGVLIALMLSLMVIFTIAQVVCRTWFTALSWSEEVTRFLLIWSTFLGASCVYRHDGNIAILIFQNLFPDSVKKILRITVHILCLILFCILCYYGFLYCGRQVRMAAAIPIRMKYIYMCLPISMIILVIHSSAMIFEELKRCQ
ncbi:MAG: TRAP transporter small permease [Synergistaceae bacterium]|nr:TRAP transporter small permease [Synergistaceae bacterium]MBR0252482.1 TRAP transporter small permease [Synergistaceae bacterium]MBR0316573.1 TRAP transporter small permease [Synergistaceae bacterium]